jgi:Flp pilus assembly protein TadG
MNHMIGGIQARLAGVAQRLLGRGIMRRLVRQQDGAAAVEFALVAAPFLALMFAIMETAMVFFASQSLETVAADSARLIMTGQAQMQGFDQDKFKQAVCDKVAGLFDCMGGLYVDVQTYSSFATMSGGATQKLNDIKALFDSSTPPTSDKFSYQAGGPGDIVVVRLIYLWPVYVPLLGLDLADMPGNKRLVMATVAFRNEPYQGDGT